VTARLRRLLVLVPEVYGELQTAAVPGRSAEPPDSRDPREKPAPGNLTVMEHRHKLVRGLRWWVDAVRDPGEHTEVAHSPARMGAWLLGHLGVMATEDQAELQDNLEQWLAAAWPLVGDVNPPRPVLPVTALDQRVSVKVAAEAVGVSRQTIYARATPEAGLVLLREVAGPPCLHDLPLACCAECALSTH
jgi:hypothetical protein